MKRIKIAVSVDDKDFFQINSQMNDKFIDDLINEIGDEIITGEQVRQFFKQLLDEKEKKTS